MKIILVLVTLIAAACVREVPVQAPAPKTNYGEYFVGKFKDKLPPGTTCEDWPLVENSVLCTGPTRIMWCHAPKEKEGQPAAGPTCTVQIDWTPLPPTSAPEPDPAPESPPEPSLPTEPTPVKKPRPLPKADKK